MIPVFIIDEQSLYQGAIKSLLVKEKGISIVGDATSAESAPSKIRDAAPNVVLLSLPLYTGNAVKIIKKLLRYDLEMKIIIISSYTHEPFPSLLLEVGAFAYLTKDIRTAELVQAIKAVATGQRYLSSEIAQRLVLRNLAEHSRSPFSMLSSREQSVAEMIVKGFRSQDISQELNLSPKTVNSYRYRIFEKLKIQSDVELSHMSYWYQFITINAETVADVSVGSSA